MPINRGGETKCVDTWLDSTLDSVDSAESSVLAVAQRLGFEDEDLHKIGMAVRESMVNAVVHGNHYSAHKKVHLAIVEASDRLTVTITDQGEGFELAMLPDPLADENLLKQSGRGILLIQAFVDEFRVQRGHPSGTEVTMTKYLGRH
jgi:serine/threonine-protein kinase RsbW